VIVGAGERLFEGVGDLDLQPIEPAWGTDLVTHLRYRVRR
jgi:hypothetical protein